MKLYVIEPIEGAEVVADYDYEAGMMARRATDEDVLSHPAVAAAMDVAIAQARAEPVAPCPECERLRAALTTTTPMRLPSGCAQADIDVGEQPEEPQP
tara:strand:- start:266 stop:559 length:294 start_codon:yes stop_codon:yes gene_type:complete